MKESHNTEILCNLDVYVQLKSMLEMFSDTNSTTIQNSDLDPHIFLINDTYGSEFSEFFKQELMNTYQIFELNLDQDFKKTLSELIDVKETSEDEETESPTADQNVTQKAILFMDNPLCNTIKEKTRLISFSRQISSQIADHPGIFFLLRLIEEEIPQELIEYIDFIFPIPYPSKLQRIDVFEKLFDKLNVHTVDITYLADLTEEKWNVIDIKRLVDSAYVQWKILNYAEFKTRLQENESTENLEQKDSVNDILLQKIPLTAEIFAEIINNLQVQPLNQYHSYADADKKLVKEIVQPSTTPSMNTNTLQSHIAPSLEGIGLAELNSFTSSQLYQYAAVNKFEELTLIIEKLDQGKKLDEVDRKILADYAFILKDNPQRALLKLTNAKKTMDRIQKITER